MLAAVTAFVVSVTFFLLSEADPGTEWAFLVVLVLLALVIGPLPAYVLVSLCRRSAALLRGASLWELRPDGLSDPTGTVFRKTVPWSACESAYVWRRRRGGDHSMLRVSPLEPYAAQGGPVGRPSRPSPPGSPAGASTCPPPRRA